MAYNAVISLLSLGFIWVLFTWAYRDYRNDMNKLQLFQLRDRLFDMALEGRISFDHPAYGLLRRSINGLLHGAEHFSLSWLTLFALEVRSPSNPIHEQAVQHERNWDAALFGMPDHTRQELQAIRTEMHLRIVEHVVLSSPIFWLLIVPVLIATLGTVLATRIKQSFARRTGIPGLDFLSEDCETIESAA